MSESLDTCRFENPGFAALQDGVFRLTRDDKVAAFAIRLDGSDVLLPLTAVAKLFEIRPDSADARMLRLVQHALRFVPQLRPGEALPPEVVTGAASWAPAPEHRKAAAARIQLLLMTWIGRATGAKAHLTAQMLAAAVDDPAIRPRVQEALQRAAQELGLPADGDAAVVTALIGQLAEEMAYIEALRERLLERVPGAVRQLGKIAQLGHALSPARRETLVQVATLATTGAGRITALFNRADDRTQDIIAALRGIELQRRHLRIDRDELYATLREWEPLLDAWDAVPQALDGEGVWRAIEDWYRFLAPRYMPVQEWEEGVALRVDPKKIAMTW